MIVWMVFIGKGKRKYICKVFIHYKRKYVLTEKQKPYANLLTYMLFGVFIHSKCTEYI